MADIAVVSCLNRHASMGKWLHAATAQLLRKSLAVKKSEAELAIYANPLLCSFLYLSQYNTLATLPAQSGIT